MIDRDSDADSGKDPPERPESAGETSDAGIEELTPEEQLAKYEESLKDEDWGHQPC